MNILYECSPKELEILEFFAQSVEERPKQLKTYFKKLSINEQAKTLAFIQVRVPKLYEKMQKLLED